MITSKAFAGLLTTAVLAGCAATQPQVSSGGNTGRSATEAPGALCAGLADANARKSPFEVTQVVGVEPIREATAPKRLPTLVGATLYVAATPGLTTEWLGRMIECHAAQAAGGTADRPDPLAVGPAKVDVFATRDGFGVTIRGSDLDAGRAILQQSKALVCTATNAETAFCQHPGQAAL